MFLDNIKFFKTPRAKQFNYQPRYYDEQKEELQKRVEAIEREVMEAKGEETKERDYSADAMRSRMDFRSQRENARRPDFMTNIRVLFIAGILAMLLYLVYWYL